MKIIDQYKSNMKLTPREKRMLTLGGNGKVFQRNGEDLVLKSASVNTYRSK